MALSMKIKQAVQWHFIRKCNNEIDAANAVLLEDNRMRKIRSDKKTGIVDYKCKTTTQTKIQGDRTQQCSVAFKFTPKNGHLNKSNGKLNLGI